MKHPGRFHRSRLPNDIGCSNEACDPEATLSDHTPGAAYSRASELERHMRNRGPLQILVRTYLQDSAPRNDLIRGVLSIACII